MDYAFEVGDLTHLSNDHKILSDMYFPAYMDLDVRVVIVALVLTPSLRLLIWLVKRLIFAIKRKIKPTKTVEK